MYKNKSHLCILNFIFKFESVLLLEVFPISSVVLILPLLYMLSTKLVLSVLFFWNRIIE